MPEKKTEQPEQPHPEDVEHVAHERKSADKPIVAADGHVVLSQADIDARNA